MGLTVAENVLLGDLPTRGRAVRWRAVREEARDALAALGITLDVERTAGSLTVAEQTMVEVAREVRRGGRVLILDEPTACLSAEAADQIRALVRTLRDEGVAVALGVKLAAPERPVVLTIGDGAFACNPVVPSYDASPAYGLPLLIVVFNNRVYTSMNLNHRRFYPEGAAAETGERLGTDLFHSDDPAGRKHRQNGLLIALDPAAFGDADAFTEAVDATLGTPKGLPVAEGADGVYYPGERSAAMADGRAEKGVPVAPKVWCEPAARAERLGVALPRTAG